MVEHALAQREADGRGVLLLAFDSDEPAALRRSHIGIAFYGSQHGVLVEGAGQPGVNHGLHGGQLVGPQQLVGHDSGSGSGRRLRNRTLTRGSTTRQAQSTSDREETSSQMRRKRAAVADQVYDHDRSAAAVAIRAAPTGSSRIDAT